MGERHATTTQGYAAAGFEGVAEEFERNFLERGELGAAFAAYRDGEPVVDLWGGTADESSGRPWAEDTLQVIFSGTKGVVAVCLLILLDRGELELDAPVARYWPEFAAREKEWILVRDLVSHTARLPGIDTPVTLEECTDDHHMAALLQAQAPSRDPRARLCYHGLTYGWLCGELIRRVDGRSVGRFLAEEVSRPLELDLWIGLPVEHEERVATLTLAATWPTSQYRQSETLERDPFLRSIWGNPPVLAREGFPWNSRAYHGAEIPGAGGIATARSLARLYGNLETLVSAETIGVGREALADGLDEAHGVEQRFGVGFQLQTASLPFGPEPDAFGHSGAGGSVHGAWPTLRVGFSYAMNLLRDDADVDPRRQALLRALHAAVSRAGDPSDGSLTI